MNPQARTTSSRTAFTLAEIIVVVVVVGIAAAVIVPQAVDSSDSQSIAAARVLAADLEYARDTAINLGTPIAVTFSVSQGTYSLTNASQPVIHPITKAAYTVKYSTTPGMSRVVIGQANFGGGSVITFSETGAPDKDGYVTLQAGAHSYRITVAPATGKVTVTGS